MDFHSAGSFPRQDQLDTLFAAASPSTALVLQRIMPSRGDLLRLRKAYGGIVFDLDDAIYAVPPDLHGSHLVSFGKRFARLLFRGSTTTSARKKPLSQTLEQVDVAVSGNVILADFLEVYASQVVEIPTTVEPVAAPPRTRPDPPVVVWMGLPDNLQYLDIAQKALERLHAEVDFVLRIVSSAEWDKAPFPVQFVRWSEEASRDALLTSTVGIAPLTDSAWTRGKCAFRSIQYGGHGLPTVASPVGITDRVVLHGKTGYLAENDQEWTRALRELLAHPDHASSMGRSALDHVRASYSDDVAIARWSDVISSL